MIQKIDEIEKEAIEIYGFVTSTIPDDLSILPTLGSELAVYIARTGKMLTDAKYYQNCAIKMAIEKYKKEKLSPSIMKQLIEADCTRENYIVDLMERLNRTATHQLDWCRTLISKGKEEMRLSNMQFK